jgi:hypothetical protein
MTIDPELGEGRHRQIDHLLGFGNNNGLPFEPAKLEGGGYRSVSSLPSHVNAERGRSNPGSPKLTMSPETLARFAHLLVQEISRNSPGNL